VDIHTYIEDYSCLWIQALRTWHDNTGDLGAGPRGMAGRHRATEVVSRSSHGARAGEGPGVRLSGQSALLSSVRRGHAERFSRPSTGRRGRTGPIARPAGTAATYAEAAASVEKAINAHLWDDKAGTYHGAIKDGTKTPPTVHAAGICLYFDVVPPERLKHVQQWFLANLDREDWAPFQFAYWQEVLARIDSDAADLKALETIRKRWEWMAHFETGTAWEAFGPAETCHDMGATPTLYLSRHVLGVQVDGPVANRRLAIEPHLGDLKRVEGVVVTEFGPVPVCWDRSGDSGRMKFTVKIPAGVKARVSLPRLAEDAKLIVDGKAVKPSSEPGRRVVTIELPEGSIRVNRKRNNRITNEHTIQLAGLAIDFGCRDVRRWLVMRIGE